MKRIFLLSIILLIAISAAAFAEFPETVNIVYGDRLTYEGNPGYYFFRFAPEPFDPMNWRAGHVYRYVDNGTGEVGFCLHLQRGSPSGPMTRENFYAHTPRAILQRLELAVAIGYYDKLPGYTDEDLSYIFTQRYIWEHLPILYYGTNPNFVGTRGESILSWRYLDMGVNSTFNDMYRQWEALLDARIEESMKTPSFSVTQIQLKVGESMALTDTNGRLGDYEVKSISEGLSASIDGQTLTVIGHSAVSGGEIILGHRSFERGVSFVYESTLPSVQDLGFFRVSTELEVKLLAEVEEEEGDILLRKVNESGEGIEGAVFGVFSDSSLSEKVSEITTNASGEARITLKKGMYYVKELMIPAPYILSDEVFSAQVEAGSTTQIEVVNLRAQGRILLSKIDAESGDPLPGAVFSLMQGSRLIETLSSGADGTVQSSLLPLGEYQLSEAQAPLGYIASAPIDITLEYVDVYTPVVEESLRVENERITKGLEIEKRSILSWDIPLGGAEFELVHLESAYPSSSYEIGEIVATLQSGDDGSITLPAVEPGRYGLRETTPPVGYERSPQGIEFVLERSGDWKQLSGNGEMLYDAYADEIDKLILLLQLQGSEQEPFTPESFEEDAFVFYNAPILSRIQLSKHTEESEEMQSGQRRPEEGIVFRLENASGDEVDRFTTGAGGYATSGLLPIGKYRLIQENTQPGYAAIPAMDIVLGESVLTLRLENAPLLSQLRIEKIDARSGERIAQAGIRFQLFEVQEGGEPIAMEIRYPSPRTLTEFETDESGSVTLPQKLIERSYWLEEIEGPEGYFLDPEAGRIEIHVTGETTVIVAENIPQLGILELEKYGEQFSGWEEINVEGYTVHVPIFEERYLSGAAFELRKNGEIIHEFTTGEGITRIEELELGEYTLEEMRAPSGYLRDETIYTLVFTPQEPHQRFHLQAKSMQNVRQSAKFTFSKTMESSPALQEAALEDVLFGLYNREELSGAAPGTLMGISRVNAEGEGSFQVLLEGAYYLKELATHEAYILSEEEIEAEFIFSPEEGEQRLVTMEAGENQLKRTFLRIVKVESGEDTPLAGAQFVIETDRDGERIHLGEGITDEKGEFLWEFTYGTYFIREINAPGGYRLNPQEKEIIIASQEDAQLTWENEPTRLLLRKIDARSKEGLQAGFALYFEDSPVTLLKAGDHYRPHPEGEHEITTDAQGLVKILGLPMGEYRLVEISTPPGYVTGKAVLFEMEEETEVFIENERTQLSIEKTDEESGEGLRAGFSITQGGQTIRFVKVGDIYMPGEGEEVIYTDEKGHLSIEKLPVGEYLLCEVAPPQGYQPSEDLPFVMEAKLRLNVLNRELPKLPDTGGRPETLLRTASIFLLGGVLLFLRRSKKRL